MTTSPHPPSPFALPPRLRGPAALLLALGGLGLGWWALRLWVNDPVRPVESKIGAIAAAALLSLLLGLAGLRRALPALQRRTASPRWSILWWLACAYLPAWLALTLPEMLVLLRQRPASLGLLRVVGPPGLAAGQPEAFLWQSLVLGLGLLLPRLPHLRRLSWPARPRLENLAVGLLGGMALWLGCTFLLGLLLAPFQGLFTPLSTPLAPALRLLLAVVGCLAAPWALESTFRMPHSPVQAAFPLRRPTLSIALVYALLQGRPLLFLPAFGFSLGLSLLAQRTQGRAPVILAHAVFNLLMLVVHPELLL